MIRRTALRRTGPPPRKVPLRAESAQRRRDQRRWTGVKALVHLRDGFACQRCGLTDPFADRLDCHHRKLRSRGGTDEPENLVTLCRPCHRWAHANPAEATEAGFMVASWDDERRSA